MEIGFRADTPTYSGGLGVLAGDTLRSAADMRVPMVAVTLIHRKGYFFQHLDQSGHQTEEAVRWKVEDVLQPVDVRVNVSIEGRTVVLRAWRYDVIGRGDFRVPIFLLDSDLPENSTQDRALTDVLYGGDNRYRLSQEILLGIGGVRILRALGFDTIDRFHMNEGHSSLLTLELLDEQVRSRGGGAVTEEDIADVRRCCVFTTHTPVPAGQDRFPLDLVGQVLGPSLIHEMQQVFCCEGELNMTYLALNLSHYINGVAKKHGDVARHMFAEYKIDAITNGVHASTWASPSFVRLFDAHIEGWRDDNFSLRYALSIPPEEVWKAHLEEKKRLQDEVNRQTGAGMALDRLTLGFGRRAATYKRADLLFRDLDRLRAISRNAGPIQIVFAGKAHPRDEEGKRVIEAVYRAAEQLRGDISIAYLGNYDMNMGGLLTAGVDVWLNTPRSPMEASGTSGMKAALNGVPSLSILDGWWIEGCIEGVTGWAIEGTAADDAADADSLYRKLEGSVIPAFYNQQDAFISIMRHAIALNGSFFNTQRMLQQYVLKAYFE
ncbi:MAG: alpha-glucan family phosphorylase [Verrucomicrobia bacterium]|nr:alpha-glucan family phosphorylase [Verrucomicrobiota bacterium]